MGALMERLRRMSPADLQRAITDGKASGPEKRRQFFEALEESMTKTSPRATPMPLPVRHEEDA